MRELIAEQQAYAARIMQGQWTTGHSMNRPATRGLDLLY